MMFLINETHIRKKLNGGCQGLGRGENEELLISVYKASVIQDEKVLSDVQRCAFRQ